MRNVGAIAIAILAFTLGMIWQDTGIPSLQLTIPTPPAPIFNTCTEREKASVVQMDRMRLVHQHQIAAFERMGVILENMVLAMAKVPEARAEMHQFNSAFDRAYVEVLKAMGWKEHQDESPNLRNFQ